MSDNSNDPKQKVDITELLEHTEVSIEVQSHSTIAYVFFGRTPRAQLAIDFGRLSYASAARDMRDMFPMATIKRQS